MAHQLAAGQLEKFIGTFYRVNCKSPRQRPESLGEVIVEQLVITKGMLRVGLTSGPVDVFIPEVDQKSVEEYRPFVSMLAEELAMMFSALEIKSQIEQALRKDGVMLWYKNGIDLVANPLTASVGELDQFPS